MEIFSDSTEYETVISDLQKEICNSSIIIEFLDQNEHTEKDKLTKQIANYLFKELQGDDVFCISQNANELHDAFLSELKKKKVLTKFNKSIELTDNHHQKDVIVD